MKSAYVILLGIFSQFLFIGKVHSETTAKDVLQEKISDERIASAMCKGFEENKGQFADSKGKPVPEIFYKASAKGMSILITSKGLTYGHL